MSKTIKISDDLERKIYDFCMDELNYHIYECGCAEEYEDEIEAQIQLLSLLGYKDKAYEFSKGFEEYMDELKPETEYWDDVDLDEYEEF